MTTLNKLWFDAQTRHSVQVQRLTMGEAVRVNELLASSEKELRKLLGQLESGDTFRSRRVQALLRDIRDMRKQVMIQSRDSHQQELFKLASWDQDQYRSMAEVYYPLAHEFATVDAKLLQSLITSTPVTAGTNAARTLDNWWSGLASLDQQRITEALQLGMVQGETIDQMTRRVMSAAELTRTQAVTAARTGVKHSTTLARDAFFEQNADVFHVLMWSSMLDGRTTLLCASRDGHFTSIDGNMEGVPLPHLEPPTANTPAHPNCRSNRVAIMDPDRVAEELGDRAFVRDARTPRRREIDFRAQAKEKAGSSWRGMSEQSRRSLIKEEKRLWAAENIGTVPGKTTYDEWLRMQPAEFQNEVLGPGKAALFRDGMKLEQYVDEAGRELTLDKLIAPVPVKPAGVIRDLSKLTEDQVDDLHAKMRDRFGITDEDWEPFAGYQGQDFDMINGSLRGSGRLPSGRLGDSVARMDAVMQKVEPVQDRFFSYRTTFLDGESATAMLGGTTPKLGAEFIDQGFVSTSLGRNCWKYGIQEVYHDGAVYNFRIVVSEGARGVQFPAYMDEAEFLLNRNTRFRVVDVLRKKPRIMPNADGENRAFNVFEVALEVIP